MIRWLSFSKKARIPSFWSWLAKDREKQAFSRVPAVCKSASLDAVFGQPKRNRTVAGLGLRQSDGLVHELLVIHNRVDEVDAVGLLSRNDFSSHDQFLGLAEANQANQAHCGARSRNDPHLDFRLAEPAAFALNAHVAGHDQLPPPTEGIAVDCGEIGHG